MSDPDSMPREPKARGGDARDDGPFRIATVSELTGVPEPTLRAWERRYGVPSPQRTTSGYRLYGAAEVDVVREMRRLCDGGMAASDAARLLLSSARNTKGKKSAPELDPFAASVEAIVQAIERFDDDLLETELRRITLTGDAEVVFERVLSPTLRLIGDKWHAGELSVAQEHFGSQRIGALLRDLMRLSSAPRGADRVVLASFADDEHELGLLGIALRLSSWGFRPVFLGARTPPSAVRSAVASVNPKLVALSTTIPVTRVRARELLEEYGAACGETPWAVGGASSDSIADLVTKMGGVVAPADVADFRSIVREMTSRKRGRR